MQKSIKQAKIERLLSYKQTERSKEVRLDIFCKLMSCLIEHKYTRREIAREIGRSPKTVSRWLKVLSAYFALIEEPVGFEKRGNPELRYYIEKGNGRVTKIFT